MPAWGCSIGVCLATFTALVMFGLMGCQSTAPDLGVDMTGSSPTLIALEAMNPDARASLLEETDIAPPTNAVRKK